MKKIASMFALAFVSIAAVGCEGPREVEVTGEAKAASTVAGPITIEFWEVPEAGADAPEAAVKSIELAKPGAFTDTVEVEGDEIRVFALVDADGDKTFDAGELWDEVKVAIAEDGTVAAITLDLAADACPTPAAKAE